METTNILRGLSVLALALATACASKAESTSLTDGRQANPTPHTGAPPASTTPGSSGGHDAGITLPIDGPAAPKPQVTSLAPASALVDGVAPTVTIAGTNFVPRTTVVLDGAAIASSFVSDHELRVTLPSSLVGQPGPHPLVALTSAPGGGTSAPVSFTVQNPVATVTTLAPNAVLAGAGDATLTLSGTNFVAGSVASLKGANLATTYVSTTQLTAVVPGADLAAAGAEPVIVTNPAPGGGPSKPLSFTIANPTVTLTSVTPATAVVGAAATKIAATGTGFVAASALSFNGSALTTTFVSASSLTATIPATSLAAIGNYPIIVTNPAPGGGVSMPITFTVGNPAPAITSLTPSTASAGDPPTTVTIDGTGFVASSQVSFGGAPSATTYVSATELTATITATELATAGSITVTVFNAAPGGGTSSPSSFTVNNPTPVLTSISPASVAQGASDTPIIAYGTSFVSGATVQANGAALTTTFVSATELHATVPATALGTAGSLAITVANPDPGGSTSGAQTLTITAPSATGDDAGASCDPTGVDVAIAASGAPQTVTLDYALGPAARFAYDPTDATTYTCPVASLATSTSAYAAIVVQNTSGFAAYLEASAGCVSTDDAYLAVYPGTSSVPSSDADREACTGYVANGASAGGGFGSTSAGGSSYCPGLTVANGGAITLPPCGTAVLLVQPYDVTQFTAPATLAVQLTTP